jgi:peptide/nickel transport system permease protein
MAVPLVFVVSILSFVFVTAEPNSVLEKVLGVQGTPEEYKQLGHKLGLDLPVYTQYWHWFKHAITGDLGVSWVSGTPVTQIISQRLPVTLSLVLCSLVLTALIGIAMGIFSAVRGGAVGRTVDGVALVGFALPGFWVAAVLLSWFAVGTKWFPAEGYVPLAESPGQWAQSLVLPVVALGLSSVIVLSKQTREAMMDVLGSEHVRMARANGIPRRYINYRLALKNASAVVVTLIGLQAIGLLLGTVFVEQVFALPGLGSALVTATTGGDIPVVQGITVLFTLIIVGINLLVDLALVVLNPKVRVS